MKITGNHFGPSCTEAAFEASLSVVTYGPLSAKGYTASGCSVTKDDIETTCSTAPGTGVNHTWQVTRGDQSSRISMQADVLSLVMLLRHCCHFQVSINSAETQRASYYNLEKILETVYKIQCLHQRTHSRYGSPKLNQDQWYCTDIMMVSPSNAISCVMAAGVQLSLVLSVDGQTSNVLENALSYGPPVISAFLALVVLQRTHLDPNL